MKKILSLCLLISSLSFAQEFNYTSYTSFLKKYVSNAGNVNYGSIKSNKAEMNAVVKDFQENLPKTNWSKDEKMAYFINLYNINTIKKVIDNYPTTSIKNIKNAWKDEFIIYGKQRLSLEQVEDKVLRKMNDPRIHFAINCASYSCPKLENEPFLPKSLNSQLDKATRDFINDDSKNTINANEVNVSQIFNWFASDFTDKNTTVIDYLNTYSKTKIDATANLKFMEYKWDLNK